MGRDATREFIADDLFLPQHSALLREPVRPRRLSRVIGWMYQLALWSVLILGAVHTIHHRVLALKEPAPGAASPSRGSGIDYLNSLLFR